MCGSLFFWEEKYCFLELIESKKGAPSFLLRPHGMRVAHRHRVTAATPTKYGLFSACRSLGGLDQFGWVWKVCLYIGIFLFNIHKFSLVLGIKWVIKTACNERKKKTRLHTVFSLSTYLSFLIIKKKWHNMNIWVHVMPVLVYPKPKFSW